jgi:hypothetical protein
VGNLLRKEDAYFLSASQRHEVCAIGVSVQVEPPPAYSLHADGNNWESETNHREGDRSNVSSLTNEPFLNGMPTFAAQETHAESQRIVLGTSPTTHGNDFLLPSRLHRRRQSVDNPAFAGQSPTERYRGSPSSQARKSVHSGFFQSFQKVKQNSRGGPSSDVRLLPEGGPVSFGLGQGSRGSEVVPVSYLTLQMEARAREGAETSQNAAQAGETIPSLPALEHFQGEFRPGDDTENVRPNMANLDTDTDDLSSFPPSDQSTASFYPGELWPHCMGWAPGA